MDDKFQYFDNVTFSDLWPSKNTFISDYKNLGFPTDEYQLDDNTLRLIWLLLLGRFADSTIKPYNIYGSFKIRFMSKVWQYAPAWKKNLDIQNKLRSLSLEDGSELYVGGSATYNSALNPGTEIVEEELKFINSQNTTKYKKSKIEGLALLTDLLKNDVTEQFLRRFDEFFKTIIYSGQPLLYETEV